MSNKIFDEISDSITKSYPNACIIYIKENTNEALIERYKEYQDQNIGCTEYTLFHGTRPENIQNIVESGFISDYNKRSALGFGTYFAKLANYSKAYMDVDKTGISYMFVCKVFVKNTRVGRNTTNMDYCTVDNKEDPQIFAVPDDSASFPKYLVAFHKNAK
jgi:hypothetical protein